ncbi:MAG: magnesium transporter [Thaumarchaeota archaeon]|nr:magnesium transporter [Nitrososphaerota archaeon]
MSSNTKENNSHEYLVDTKITKKFLAFLPSQTVEKIEEILDVRAKEFETIGYVYVVDENGVLLGVSSLKHVLQAKPTTRLEEIMNKDVISIKQHSDQERAVYVALKHGLKAIPVVDNEKRLIGVIPHNTILSIFHHEVREDVLRSGGIHHKIKEIESLKTPATRLVRARLPSLFIGLLGGLIAAAIISNFESFLNEYIILASFIPVIVYLSDAIGTQSQTLVIRMLALEPNFSLRRYMFREIRIGSFLGFIFAISLFAAAFFGWGKFNLGIVIGLSIFLSMVSQAFFSTSVSILFEKFGIDPATSSGPIATIISDIMTIAMYFGIAVSLLYFLTNQ